MQLTVLGAGLVGRAIAVDLAREARFTVTVADRDEAALERLAQRAAIHPLARDLSAPGAVEEAVAGAELVVCAVPGWLGFEVLQRVLEAGKSVVDISFFPEDPFALDALARERGVTAIVDCGVAPGLCNLLAGHAASRLEPLDSYRCFVGGLPRLRRKPFEYAAVFSPADVIEEYTRPARLRLCGRDEVRPALSDVELLELPGIGTLEAFDTDGLRTLLRTLDAPTMIEKTLRYPGHAELMRAFRDSGFFDLEPLELGGTAVRPRDLTARLLFEQWRLPEGEPDLTVMRVVLEGRRDGARRRLTFDLLDQYDAESDTTAMARTTGYTCTAALRLLADGRWREPGVIPPERLGADADCYQQVLADLAARGVVVRETVEQL